jgi:hypothetical protein
MAKLKSPVLGNVSGTVGNIVFTEKGDSSILYRKTKRTARTATTSMVAMRDKFKLVASIAIGVNRTGLLKKLWPSNPKIRRSHFNAIFQGNYPVVRTITDLGKPIMAPGVGFPIANGVITKNTTGLSFGSDSPGMEASIDPNVEKSVIACGVVILSNPINAEDAAFKVLPVKTSMQSLDSDAPINLSNTYLAEDLVNYQAYTDKKIYLVLLTLNSDGTPVRRSVQFVS